MLEGTRQIKVAITAKGNSDGACVECPLYRHSAKKLHMGFFTRSSPSILSDTRQRLPVNGVVTESVTLSSVALGKASSTQQKSGILVVTKWPSVAASKEFWLIV